MPQNLENFKQVNLDASIELGKLLSQSRIAANEDVAEIAKNLTLSKKQMTGLEIVDFSGFHSSTYYFLAAKKYASHLKVDFDFDTLINPTPDLIYIPSGDETGQKNQINQSIKNGHKRKSLNKKHIAYSAFCLLLVIFGTRPINHQAETTQDEIETGYALPSDQPQAQEQAQKTDADSHVAAVETNPVTAPEAEKIAQIDDSEIHIEVSDNTWIQVIYRNDEKVQKNYSSGEVLNLKREELKGLVVGNAKAIKLIAASKQQDISAFVQPDSNLAKIFGQKLRAIGT